MCLREESGQRKGGTRVAKRLFQEIETVMNKAKKTPNKPTDKEQKKRAPSERRIASAYRCIADLQPDPPGVPFRSVTEKLAVRE